MRIIVRFWLQPIIGIIDAFSGYIAFTIRTFPVPYLDVAI